jgi:polyisoprenyl-phosphate glycosyltransferase
MIEIKSHIRSLRGPILVTGASGFVGANLYKRIAAFRSDVYAVVRREKGWRLTEVPDEKIIAADLNDHAAAKNLVAALRPQTVLHCLAYGAYSFEEDANLIYETNVVSLVNFVELLSKAGFAAFVHAGSSSEYGTRCSGPNENTLCEPNSHYSVSKVAAANYIYFGGKTRQLPCVNLRLYSVYGPLEDTSRLVPSLMRKALDGQLPPFVDPRTSRDFVYVDDVCDAFIVCAAKMNPDLYGESINIGSGAKTTIKDLAELTRTMFAISNEPKFGTMEGRTWDLADWYADARKAKDALGWEATTSLEDGLRTTSTWVATLSDLDLHNTTKRLSRERKRSVSAIVACYKDGQAIPHMHERLTKTFQKLGVDYEIILVNDGSPDDSAEVIRAISANDPKVIGITHSRNFGSQMAFRSGMELSTMDSVVLLDGDLQDPPELIEQFYQKYEEGWDVVYGRRIKRDMPWYWGIMYKAFYRIFAAFSYVKIPLDAGDFSLMDRRVVGWLLNCPERDLFVRGLRAYVGFKQTGVDYVRPERMFGVSTNNFYKNVEWAKKGIFSFSNAPLTMLTTGGVVLLGISLVLAIASIIVRLVAPQLVPAGLTTVVILTLMFGSINLFAVGLVGEYVAKIMEEVKQRPRLVRAALIRNGQFSELLPDGKSSR